jgi:xylulokinase
VEIVEAEEGAAYGAAILAGVGAGAWRSVDAACDEIIRIACVVAPQPEAVEQLSHRYEAYRRMYRAIHSVLQ